ncbi:TPA: glycosyltransferase, partial [Escherichia coli]|nr:glycosyltransferase [Escherichia coli]
MIAVDIALATYNGANFIRQQIESIQKQTYRNWRLIISDDNSSDDTVDIIKDMMSN